MDPALALGRAASLAASQAPNQPSSHARQLAVEFEESFLSVMMNTMMEGLGNDPVTGGGEAEDTYRSMMTEQYAKAIAESGGIGVADQIYRELVKLQEAAQ